MAGVNSSSPTAPSPPAKPPLQTAKKISQAPPNPTTTAVLVTETLPADLLDEAPASAAERRIRQFLHDTVDQFDQHGTELSQRWAVEHAQINDVIDTLKGEMENGPDVMTKALGEALTETLKTRVDHSKTLQQYLESRVKLIAALKADKMLTVNVGAGSVVSKGEDPELQALLDQPTTDYHLGDE
jgi:hypothetical protein